MSEARNPFKFMPDGSVRITLTQGQYVLIDAEDFAVLSRFEWYAEFVNGTYHAATRLGGGHPTYLHNVAMMLKNHRSMLHSALEDGVAVAVERALAELDGADREGLRLMMERVFEGLKQGRDGRLRLLEHLALIAGLGPSDRDTATRSLLENLDDVARAEFWASADAAEDSDGAIAVALVYDEVARRARETDPAAVNALLMVGAMPGVQV